MGKFTSAVILAAGTGSRFGGEIKKQYTGIGGEPCLVRTVSAFENCPLINEIVIVGAADEIKAVLSGYSFGKIHAIVSGGETRRDSALCGFDAISDSSDYVAIHDGARCLVTPEMIEKTVKAAYKFRIAAAAHKSEDTVKVCDREGVVEDTADREKIWLVQTPQVFLTDIYRVAAYTAKKDGAAVTDDCMMCERLGFKVKMVECGRENIKLTVKDDLYLAEAVIESRKMRKIQ